MSVSAAAVLRTHSTPQKDLVGDIVTLFSWRLSRKPPSDGYPFGYGKFEVLGTAVVSILLTGGALGIGYHSLTHLLEALAHSAAALPAGAVHDVVAGLTRALPAAGAAHAGHEHALEPNAAWFALAGVLGKEWLFRATKRIADEERSPALYANALHHRSDVYGSSVALVAILGTWWFPHLPLDPIGGELYARDDLCAAALMVLSGILVSVLIVKQSWGVLADGFHQLTDGGVSPRTRQSLIDALAPLLPEPGAPPLGPSAAQVEAHTENLLGIRELRAMRVGGAMFVDLVADVPRTLSVGATSALEAQIVSALKGARREVKEVRVRFHPADQEEVA